MSKREFYQLVALPDTHHRATPGGEDKKSIKAVLNYIEDTGPDEIVHLGDLLDFNCISSHNKAKLRKVEKGRILDDYEVGNRFLDKLESAAPGVPKVLIEGNHDYRVEAYIDEFPVTQGLLEVDKGLHLKDRDIKWVRYWSKGTVYKATNNCVFIHGKYVNSYHAKSHVDCYGRNIFYGHLHDVQCHPKVWAGDQGDTIVGQSLGCLCDYNQDWMHGSPTKWQQAFGIFYFRPDGYFNYQVVMIFNHKFIVGGKLYKP